MPTYIVRLFHRDDGQVLGLVEFVERRATTPFHSFPELCSVLEGAAHPENRNADPSVQDLSHDGG
jgi:hypothetical protein